MPSRRPRTPSYRLHKARGLAVVTLGGKDHYLGKYGTPESRAEYDRVVAEWLARGRPQATPSEAAHRAEADMTVAEVLAAYLRFARVHFSKGGSPTQEFENIAQALRPLRRLYGHTPAREFGPLSLKAVRREMVAAGLCRTLINQRVGRVVRLFKWAASEELVPAPVHQALRSVSGLQPGRSQARESEPVRPVPDADVDAIRPHVARQVWAMIELQRLTGMRPGEVTTMRTRDVETSGEVWVYTPEFHKTAHRGKSRAIYLGPRAQEILRPWLRHDAPTAYLFSPAEAVAERRAAMRAARKSKVPPSQLDRSKPGAKRAPRARYDTRTYHHSIRYGCRRAGIDPWHPHQLRHSSATSLRREFGLEAARVILGHASSSTTEIYAEADREKAAAVMARVG